MPLWDCQPLPPHSHLPEWQQRNEGWAAQDVQHEPPALASEPLLVEGVLPPAGAAQEDERMLSEGGETAEGEGSVMEDALLLEGVEATEGGLQPDVPMLPEQECDEVAEPA